MTDIFVSYKSEDRARVAPLVEALTAHGLSVWWDVHIEGGAAWRETIQANLDAAACVIVIWSETSVGPQGHFVQDEASRAKRRGVYLPVAIDEVEPPLGFGQDHALKLADWRGGRGDPYFQDILAAAQAIVAGGPRPQPLARARAASRPRRPWTVAAIGAVILVVAGGLALSGAPDRLCAAAGRACPWRVARTPANSIAVLPLANLSGDPGQDYFADGLTEELIGSLSRLGGLQVAGRTSSFKFKASKETSSTIGRRLGVSYLIDGSVRREGSVVRVSAQLIDADSGFERWSQTYDREMKDVFAVQSGIAEAVAEALKVRLLGGDIAALSRGGTTNPQAYDAYLRGRRQFVLAGDEASYRAVLARLDEAVAADPRFAAAHAARARVLNVMATEFAEPAQIPPTFAQALAAARRAVELSPDLAEAQAALGQTLLYSKLDFSKARPAYARALETGSGDADVLTWYGFVSCLAGDFGPGLDAARRATVLDPLNPKAFKSLGLSLIAARRYPDAIAAMRQALQLSPGGSVAHSAIGDALVLQGQPAAAKLEYALEPRPWKQQEGLAIALRKLGDDRGAEAAMKALTDRANGVTDFQQAEVLAQWGQTDRAITALEAAFRSGDSGVVTMFTDPLLDSVRGDPRFARLVARLGLAG